MIDFSTLQGLTIPEGTVTEIKDAAGNVLWSMSKPYLTFSSPNTFSISVTDPGWDGELQYSNGTTSWTTWDGSQISGTKLYFRGIGNTTMTDGGFAGHWSLSGTDVSCSGRIDNLLDYQTVRAGQTPVMANFCYASMFEGCTGLTRAPELPATTLSLCCYTFMFAGCTSLTTIPALPATTLAGQCYRSMFEGCTSLTTIPALPATTLDIMCYFGMFSGCTKIKLSETQTGTYTQAYRIPMSGDGIRTTDSLGEMFSNTGGTFTGTPSINTTYYLDQSCSIV